MIKCPECGHSISDKAHVCPSCGVEIANHITTCPLCGGIYFKDEAQCPHCHHRTSSPVEPTPQAAANQDTPTPITPQQPASSGETAQQPVPSSYIVEDPIRHQATAPTPPDSVQRNNKTTFALIAVIALLILGFGLYFYSHSRGNNEQDAYEYALKSNDPAVLESYLANYQDASPEHRDQITDLLSQLKQTDQDWTNAVVSGSKAALSTYLDQYPNSIHKAEALHKIDSLDWALASSANTMEAYKLYTADHPNGEHIDEANTAMSLVKAKTVSSKEKEMIAAVFRHFFHSINERNDESLTAVFSDFMTTFLGKTGASKSDVVAFLNKIYKDDITAMEWRANNDYKIAKREIGIDEYEYTVEFSARQKIERTDASKEKEALYRIKAKVNPDGKITELNMVKILE